MYLHSTSARSVNNNMWLSALWSPLTWMQFNSNRTRGGFNRECGFFSNYKHSQSVRRWNVWKYYRSAPPSILNCNGLPFKFTCLWFCCSISIQKADDIHNIHRVKSTRLQFMHRIEKLILSERKLRLFIKQMNEFGYQILSYVWSKLNECRTKAPHVDDEKEKPHQCNNTDMTSNISHS